MLLLAVVLGFSGVSAGLGAGGVGVGAGGFGVGSTGLGAGVGGFSTTGLVGCTTSAGKSFRTTAFTLGGGVLAGFWVFQVLAAGAEEVQAALGQAVPHRRFPEVPELRLQAVCRHLRAFPNRQRSIRPP